jgi:hypothetical protein
MKTSNKLLIGGFTLVVLLIVTIHIGLYAKYKAGDFTSYNPDAYLPSGVLQTFPGVRVVELHNVLFANIQFSDVAQAEKWESDEVQLIHKGDSLLVTAKDSTGPNRELARTHLRLPGNITLLAHRSSFSIEPGRKKVPVNASIYLNQSTAEISDTLGGLVQGKFSIEAGNNSTVLFRNKTNIGALDVQLRNSMIRYDEGNIGQLAIAADSLSRISLPSQQLLKANFRKIE